ncbi:MAG: hypothetical protein CMG71_04295 [Candidatus Marinimicrobia bacterium]|nr:hypothetical protein [Candidatus Neomarinimicrobiota bacterium]|tara:strand:- start:19948 stop:20904 length:957 start_codon:yes stop_codon:yes gene_type:complete
MLKQCGIKSVILYLSFTPLIAAEFGSQIFFDLNTSSQERSISTFQIRRAYLDFRDDISDNLSVRVTTDASTSIADGRVNTYIKFAQLIWKTTLGQFIIGSQPTNYFGALQKNWGFRYVEKYAANLYGFDATADLGISWKRNWNRLLIHFGAYNGTGFKKPEDDSYKRVSLLMSYGEQDLTANGGMNAGGALSVEPYATVHDEISAVYRYGGFAGYANSKVRLGGEIQIERDEGLDHQERIVATYVTLTQTEKLAFLGRVDIYDASVSHPEMRKTTFLGGVSYAPAPQFQLSPNIRYISFGTEMLEPYWVGRLSFYYRF